MSLTQRLPYSTRLIAGGLFIAGFILYIGTLAPSVVTIFDDSLEFQLVTYQLGIAHPTGYPLYTLLGKLFTFIPIGDVAYRVNLMSAVFGAATVALLYLLILQIASPKKGDPVAIGPPRRDDIPDWPLHLGGIIGALLLAVGPVFWQQATIAEVYTLNAFFVVSLLLLTISLPLFKGGQRGVLWLAVLAGLSLTHHRTILLLFPALALYLFLACDKSYLLKPKTLLLSLLFFTLPLLLYLYLPWRGHVGSLDGTYQNTWAGFWQQASASGYGLFIFGNPFEQTRPPSFYGNLLADQFYTIAPGLIGIAYLLVYGRRKKLLLTGLAFLAYFIFNISYNVTDIEVFFIPNFLIWGVWSGAGAAFLLYAAAGIKVASPKRKSPPVAAGAVEATAGHPIESGPSLKTSAEPEPAAAGRAIPEPAVPEAPGSPKTISKRRPWQPVLVAAALAIFGLMIFQLFQTSLAVIKQSYTWQVHDYGLDILQQPLPAAPDGEAVIVSILGEMTLIRYFQQTKNRRPDIETVTADLETERIAAVENRLAAGKSVYLTRQLSGAPKRWSLSAVGPLIRVNPEPVTTPSKFSFAVTRAVTPEITLLGYNLSRPPHTGPGPAPLRLTLFWQVNEPIAADLKVSARLLSPTGQVQAVVDAVPVHFAYPTTAWRPGEIVSDVYDLALPVDAPPGRYTPLIIWYDPAQNAAEVGQIELEPVVIK